MKDSAGRKEPLAGQRELSPLTSHYFRVIATPAACKPSNSGRVALRCVRKLDGLTHRPRCRQSSPTFSKSFELGDVEWCSGKSFAHFYSS